MKSLKFDLFSANELKKESYSEIKGGAAEGTGGRSHLMTRCGDHWHCDGHDGDPLNKEIA
ncbi:MAG: hypothetical protein GQ574_03575 [Crocinitomix sp.]|nr:hypothetical protein [Crocinitomix sp.]